VAPLRVACARAALPNPPSPPLISPPPPHPLTASPPPPFAVDGKTGKVRKFVETIELQISLRNYDPNKDKRFSGTLRLPATPRPNLKVCMLGSEVDNKKAKEAGIDSLVRSAPPPPLPPHPLPLPLSARAQAHVFPRSPPQNASSPPPPPTLPPLPLPTPSPNRTSTTSKR
jgi:hypothetical protein